ncbi:MAG: hypothetical protein ABFC56_14545 [Clostridiaceae bacterium]
MNDQQFMRIALALQNQSATTFDKNLSSIIAVILLDSEESHLSAESIAESIRERFSLEVDYLEVINAISRKGTDKISSDESGYFLTEPARIRLKSLVPFEEQLSQCISEYCEENRCESKKSLQELILRYVYFCFNASSSNLLYLLHHNGVPKNTDFIANNEEIVLINNFLAWDNVDKNRIIYILVSICYEYCLMTVKKDDLVSKNVFRGKRFLLDANIIFRMAGFNNDERKYVINKFVQKCQDVNIELCYTSATYDELFRVVDSKVSWIRSITGGQEPISIEALEKIESDYKANDFYRMYLDWCNSYGNLYSDFDSFRSFLNGIIISVLKKITFAELHDSDLDFDSKSVILKKDSLFEYKEARCRNKPSKASIETDIANILYVRKLRKSAQDSSIWSTNDFFVSADQILIDWAQQEFKGIPLVVIPSVWLSLILRFSGRTDDDYQAFCTFMQLRLASSTEAHFDADEMITVLNQKTTLKEIKEKIIEEIVSNKARYPYRNAIERENTAEKAFDVILQQEKEEYREKIIEIKSELEERASTEQNNNDRDAEREVEYRKRIIESKAGLAFIKYSKRIDHAKNAVVYIGAFFAILLIAILSIWLNSTSKFTEFIDHLIPQKLTDIGWKIAFIALVYAIAGGAITLVYKQITHNLSTEEHSERARKRIYKRIERKINRLLDI